MTATVVRTKISRIIKLFHEEYKHIRALIKRGKLQSDILRDQSCNFCDRLKALIETYFEPGDEDEKLKICHFLTCTILYTNTQRESAATSQKNLGFLTPGGRKICQLSDDLWFLTKDYPSEFGVLSFTATDMRKASATYVVESSSESERKVVAEHMSHDIMTANILCQHKLWQKQFDSIPTMKQKEQEMMMTQTLHVALLTSLKPINSPVQQLNMVVHMKRMQWEQTNYNYRMEPITTHDNSSGFIVSVYKPFIGA